MSVEVSAARVVGVEVADGEIAMPIAVGGAGVSEGGGGVAHAARLINTMRVHIERARVMGFILLLSNLAHQIQDRLHLRQTARKNFAVPHPARAIDDDNGALAVTTFFTPHAIRLRHSTFRMKVGEQGKRDAAQLFGKSLMRVDAVYADAQHVGLELGEARQIGLQRFELGASTAGKIEDVESENDRLAAQIGEAQRALAGVREQTEIGRHLPHSDGLLRHECSLR